MILFNAIIFLVKFLIAYNFRRYIFTKVRDFRSCISDLIFLAENDMRCRAIGTDI